MSMEKIIRTVRRYRGQYHPTVYDKPVVVVAVHRCEDEEQILRSDDEIGELRPDDIVKYAPVIVEKDGRTRTSSITSEASPCELGPVEGEWSGELTDAASGAGE